MTHAWIRAATLSLAVLVAAPMALLAGTAMSPMSERQPMRGPGLGNLAYTEAELFQPVSLVKTETAPGAGDGDLPFRYPGRQAYGSNVALMLNGYFVLMFAPDSGQSTGGFLVYDVSNPRKPRLVKKIYEPTGRTAEFREPHAIGQATIGGRQYLAVPSTRGIEFWDFTDVNDIRQVSKLALPTVDGGDYTNVSWQLWWQAPHVYVASADDGMYIVDARDPARPVLAQRGRGRPNPVPTGELGGFRVGPIFTMGNHLVLSSMESYAGLASLDISDPLNPRLLDAVDQVPFYYATCFDGGNLYGSARGQGARMFSYDLSDPARFVPRDSRLAMDDQLYCGVQDQFLFQGAQVMIHKIDVSDPLNHRHVGRGGLFPEGSEQARHSDHGQVTPMGNLVFVGNDHGVASGFIVHDRKPDTTPPRVRQVSPRPGAREQATTSRVGIALTDNILPESVHAGSFIVRPRGAAALAGTYSVQLGIVNFSPDQPLAPHTTYEVVLPAGGLKDYAGNPIATTYRARFTTGAARPATDAADLAEAAPGQVHGAASQAAAGNLQHAVRVTAANGEQTLLVNTRADFNPTALAQKGARYRWSFGDGTPRKPFTRTLRASHRFMVAGHYNVVLTVRLPGGAESTYTFHRTVINPPTAKAPTHSSNIVGTATQVFSVNPDSGTVAAIDAATLRKTWETRVGTEPRTLAVAPDGRVWVSVRGEDKLVALKAADGSIAASVALPYGSAPHGIVFTPDQAAGLVTLEGRSTLMSFDPANGSTLATLVLPGDVRGIAVNADATLAYVTRFRSRMDRGEVYRVGLEHAGKKLSLHRAVALRVDRTTVDAENRARGVPNYLHQIVISPDGLRAVLPSKKDNIVGGVFRDGRPLEHDTTVRSILTQLALKPDTAEVAAEQLDFNDRAPARAAAYSPHGDYLFVAQMEGNRVAIVDAYNRSVRGEIDTGLAPHGLYVDPQRKRLYVNNFLGRSVSVVDIAPVLSAQSFATKPLATVATVAVEPLHEAVLRGKRVFYNAADRRMSRDNYLSCASCHADGGDDGMVWDFTQRGEGLRRTISLQGRQGLGHGRVHWSANFDELQDFEHDIRGAFGGTGFLSDADFAATSAPLGAPKAGRSAELDDLAAYLSSLSRHGRSPARQPDGSLTVAAVRGQQLFASMKCASCHAGTTMSNGQRHDVGTIQPSSGKGMNQALAGAGFDTPTLYGLWASSAFFHNGQAATLQDLFKAGHGGTQSLSEADVAALAEYVRSMDDSSPLPEMR
jgi:DNA-binding beta-propeller fold protein YncE